MKTFFPNSLNLDIVLLFLWVVDRYCLTISGPIPTFSMAMCPFWGPRLVPIPQVLPVPEGIPVTSFVPVIIRCQSPKPWCMAVWKGPSSLYVSKSFELLLVQSFLLPLSQQGPGNSESLFEASYMTVPFCATCSAEPWRTL